MAPAFGGLFVRQKSSTPDPNSTASSTSLPLRPGKSKPSKPSKPSKTSKAPAVSNNLTTTTNAVSSPVVFDEKASLLRNKEIEKRLWEDKKRADKEVKIILLGAGESGKSTIVKQMRIIHNGGFDDRERRKWKNTIFHNLVDAFLDIFELMETQGNTRLEYPENEQFVEMLESSGDVSERDGLPQEYAECFRELWADEGVQLALLKGNECALHDNLYYFIEHLDRLFDPSYLPSDQDILRTRLRTTGIVETFFDIGNYTYRMVDVGGQRSERKKWIHAFDNVNCVLFIAAISGYDQALVEEHEANQMDESLMLFTEIANNPFFRRASIILFLNKIDLLQEKVLSGISPVKRYYPDFTGKPRDIQAAQKFFRQKFMHQYRREGKQKELYTHYTNATDTSLLEKTMDSVQQTILHHNLTTVIL